MCNGRTDTIPKNATIPLQPFLLQVNLTFENSRSWLSNIISKQAMKHGGTTMRERGTENQIPNSNKLITLELILVLIFKLD